MNVYFSLRGPTGHLPQSKTRTCRDLALAGTQLAELQPGTAKLYGVSPKHRHNAGFPLPCSELRPVRCKLRNTNAWEAFTLTGWMPALETLHLCV